MASFPQQGNKHYHQHNAKDKSGATSPNRSVLSTDKRTDNASD